MSTYSGKLENSTENYLQYDYNYACGFISVAESPCPLKSAIISG